MKGRLSVTIVVTLLSFVNIHSQVFSLHDSTISFKSREGKVLSKDEGREYMKGVFSTRQENVGGKKIITIIPSGNEQVSKQQQRLDVYINSLTGQPAGPFHFTDINNKKWDSDKLKGRVVVINFWFTACKPCILEMPHLNKLVADNKDSVVFIAPAPENEQQIRKFLKKYSFDYNIIPSSSDYVTKLNVENFPTHVVIDKEGIIRQVMIGYADDIKEKLQAEIDKLMSNGSK